MTIKAPIQITHGVTTERNIYGEEDVTELGPLDSLQEYTAALRKAGFKVTVRTGLTVTLARELPSGLQTTYVLHHGPVSKITQARLLVEDDLLGEGEGE